jgi:hypothetical protein
MVKRPGPLSLSRRCGLLMLSRAVFYYHLRLTITRIIGVRTRAEAAKA